MLNFKIASPKLQAFRLRSFSSDTGAIILALLWPLCYLTPYIQYGPQGKDIGNDFYQLYYKYKVYLLDVVCTDFRIPLWSPSEGCGFPFYSNPFAAVFYPLNILLALYYKITGGYSAFDHQVFTVCGLSIYCAGLFCWLRSLGLSVHAALFSGLIMGTSLKLTEILRFPNAVHSAAWMPWILYGINLAFRPASRWKGAICIAISTLMILTAGYPYYAYYLQFLLIPYLALLFIPPLRQLVIARAEITLVKPTKAIAPIFIGFALPVICCLPYLLKIFNLMAVTRDREGRSISYSTEHGWGLSDTIGAWIYPPATLLEGLYYFGALSVLLIIFYLLSLITDSNSDKREKLLAIILLGWLAAVTYITLGASSSLFIAMWHYWPGFSALRIWPRLNIIMVPIIALLLGKAYTYYTNTIAATTKTGKTNYTLCLTFLYIPLGLIQIAFLLANIEHGYWANYIKPFFPIEATYYIYFCAFSFFLLVAILQFSARLNHFQPFRAITLLTLVMFTVNMTDTGMLGTVIWSLPRNAYSMIKKPVDVGASLRTTLTTPRQWKPDTIQHSSSYSIATIPNWYFNRYITFLQSFGLEPNNPVTPEQLQATRGFTKFMGLDDGQRIFFVRNLHHKEISAFLEDAALATAQCGTSFKVTKYNGDILDVELQTSCAGYLCFIDNWDPDWRAEIDAQVTQVELLFGTFKAVQVNAGNSKVRFVYLPFAILKQPAQKSHEHSDTYIFARC